MKKDFIIHMKSAAAAAAETPGHSGSFSCPLRVHHSSIFKRKKTHFRLILFHPNIKLPHSF